MTPLTRRIETRPSRNIGKVSLSPSTRALLSTLFLAALLSLAIPAATAQQDANPASIANSPAANAPTPTEPALDYPAFEAATIRLTDRHAHRDWVGTRLDPSGRYTALAMPLRSLIGFAYLDVSGKSTVVIDQGAQQAPKWLTSDLYDIHAKIDGQYLSGWDKLSATQQRDVIRPMVRRLLAERFHVKMRVETRDTPVYALVQAKGGAHLTEVPAPEPVEGAAIEARSKWIAVNPGKLSPGSMACSPDQCTGHAVTMTGALFQMASTIHTDRILLDETGLTGYYDFTFSVSRKSTEPAMSQVEEELGLKFTPRIDPIKTYIFESAEKPSLDKADLP